MKKKKTVEPKVSAVAPENELRSLVSTQFKQELFHTTTEQLAGKWREVRLGKLSVVKSAVCTDEAGWTDMLDHVKQLVANPPDISVQIGFEMFSGGTHIGFRPDWEKSQLSSDGTIVILHHCAGEGMSLALAPREQYGEGFTVEGLDYVRGARLVVVAAQLPT